MDRHSWVILTGFFVILAVALTIAITTIVQQRQITDNVCKLGTPEQCAALVDYGFDGKAGN